MKARTPSSKTHRMRPMDGINLTPFIDMITCLMFFLLMFAAIIPVALIDAPLPKVASTAAEIKKAQEEQHQLDVTVFIDRQVIRVKSDVAPERDFPVVQGKAVPEDLHKYLVTLHQKRPNSKEITLIPADDVAYDAMIQVMDASRELVKGDPGFETVPAEISQKPESLQFNRLFPDVSIGGI